MEFPEWEWEDASQRVSQSVWARLALVTLSMLPLCISVSTPGALVFRACNERRWGKGGKGEEARKGGTKRKGGRGRRGRIRKIEMKGGKERDPEEVGCSQSGRQLTTPLWAWPGREECCGWVFLFSGLLKYSSVLREQRTCSGVSR